MKRIWMLAALCFTCAAQQYWPERQWRTATPESQGIDSAALTAALDQITQQQLGVHSLLVIRHGYAVLDSYIYPYNSGTPHDEASVTKTLTSTLTGIAVGQGLIKLDQKLLSFFPNERPADPDPQKQHITLEHMVRMESGMECGYAPGEQELEQMKRSPNWVKFALALPMKYDPGTRSAYCSPGYHLLGSVIGAAAKQTEQEFARKNLFEPLGIRDGIWKYDPQGRSHGWGDSHFYPQDLAKIGYLYLHGGAWKGKQIVPRDWVAMSTAPHAGARGEHGGMGYEWNVSNGPNGRQYGGTGRGGQSLIVWPDLDTVVVINAGGNGGQIATAIRQAVKSAEPLPANPEAHKKLLAKAADVANPPAAAPAPELPAMARSISGVVYDFPVNSSRLDSLSLTFPDAAVKIRYQGEDLTIPIGLDGRYKLGPHGPLGMLAGARGKWAAENEFQLDLNFVANINHYNLGIRFDSDRIEVTASESSGLIRNGKLTGTRRAR